MTLSKDETNTDILSDVKARAAKSQLISPINVRHVDSVHPLDCACDVCLNLKFTPNISMNEKKVKDRLGYYDSDSPKP